ASFSRLTTWYSTRNGFLKPRSFGARMWYGSWPPSNPGRMLLRAFEPLVPRPAVLPFEPSPRPTRVLSFLAPGAGRRWCTFSTGSRLATSSSLSDAFFAVAFAAVAFAAGAFAAGAFSAFASSALAAAAFAGPFAGAAVAGALLFAGG